MSAGNEALARVVAEVRGLWKPPPLLSLPEWADAHFIMSPESSASPGRWTTHPIQRGWMEAITDEKIEQVVVMKSARLGYTLSLLAAIGRWVHQDPTSVLIVLPTVEGAKMFSKDFLAPCFRDVDVLRKIIFEDVEDTGPRGSGNTILHKHFPGGVLSLVGSNSGAGFRMSSRRVGVYDEIDAFPESTGPEGDPIELAKRRAQGFWNRKFILGSTPLLSGSSRIERAFLDGDRRRYFVPCPHCDHMAPLVFRRPKDEERDEEEMEQPGEGGPAASGHALCWETDKPETAFFACERNGCVIEPAHKRRMLERGEWRAEKPFKGTASFHAWGAYSLLANVGWSDIAREFIASRAVPKKLQTFVNTVLADTWKEQGHAPDESRLYRRREAYTLVPDAAWVLTAGVDVQKDRWVYEVVAWGTDLQSWSMDAGEVFGDPSNREAWAALDEVLSRTYRTEAGAVLPIRLAAVDSGYATADVYRWARGKVRVIAVKGRADLNAVVGIASPVDVKEQGKRITRGLKVWPVGVDVVKEQLYQWLDMKVPSPGAPFPPGYCHFPETRTEGYFRQLSAEHQVTRKDRHGYTHRVWEMRPGYSANHALDCRVYARAAAAVLGVDRMRRRPAAPVPRAQAPSPPPVDPPRQPPRPAPPPAAAPRGFLSGGRNRGNGWLR